MDALDAGGRQRLALLGIVLAVAGAIWGAVEVAGASNDYGTNTVAAKLFPTVIAAVVFTFVIGSGVRLVERQKILAPIGYLTILLGLLAFAAAARDSFRYNFTESGDLYEILWISAVAAGQISLLLSWPRREDRGPTMATAVLAVLAIVAVAVAYAVEISSNGPDVNEELIGILLVAYLLGLVLVPLVSLASSVGLKGTARSGTDGLALHHASILAADPAALARFYSILLGAEAVSRRDDPAVIDLGRRLQVRGLDVSSMAGPEAGHTGTVGLSFAWPGSPESATEMLRAIGATAISGPVGTVGALGADESVSGRDPEGNPVELICRER